MTDSLDPLVRAVLAYDLFVQATSERRCASRANENPEDSFGDRSVSFQCRFILLCGPHSKTTATMATAFGRNQS
jgi:hypothetical protein